MINTLLAIWYSFILSTWPNHLNTLWSALLANSLSIPAFYSVLYEWLIIIPMLFLRLRCPLMCSFITIRLSCCRTCIVLQTIICAITSIKYTQRSVLLLLSSSCSTVVDIWLCNQLFTFICETLDIAIKTESDTMIYDSLQIMHKLFLSTVLD